MELKEKLLQVTMEKDDLTKERDELLKEKEQFSQRPLLEATTLIAPIFPQQVDAEELCRSLAQVSLKEKEISELLSENKEYKDRIDKLKERLLGRETLQFAQHAIWDLVSVEVDKMWNELKRMEAKKSYIYSITEKLNQATEHLSRVHNHPIEKAQLILNFLKYSSDEVIQAFKIQNKYQIMILVQRILTKDEMIKKVK